MVDRVSDADRLKAIELVNNLDSKLLDYVTENKDKLYLHSELYNSLEAAGLEARNPRHWELITESLEAKLNGSLAVRTEEILEPFPDFKGLYLRSCKKVKNELIEIFRGYILSREHFEIDPKDYTDLKGFPYVKMAEKQLEIVFKDFCPSIFQRILITKPRWGKAKVQCTFGYSFGDFDSQAERAYEDGFNSSDPLLVNFFYENFSDFCELPKTIKLLKEKWKLIIKTREENIKKCRNKIR